LFENSTIIRYCGNIPEIIYPILNLVQFGYTISTTINVYIHINLSILICYLNILKTLTLITEQFMKIYCFIIKIKNFYQNIKAFEIINFKLESEECKRTKYITKLLIITKMRIIH